jgi:hypothetical protein
VIECYESNVRHGLRCLFLIHVLSLFTEVKDAFNIFEIFTVLLGVLQERQSLALAN